jgi:hypothetical protein
MNFCVLSHNEPEIFRLLNSLMGERVYVLDDFSHPDHLARIIRHGCLPTVLQRKLGKDFSAQRNYLHRIVPEGEWMCWLDPDEEIIPSVFLPVLKEASTRDADAIICSRVNLVLDGPKVTFRSYERHIRAYKNDGKVTWEGPLHEKPVGADKETMGEEGELLIAHVKTEQRWNQQKEFYDNFL